MIRMMMMMIPHTSTYPAGGQVLQVFPGAARTFDRMSGRDVDIANPCTTRGLYACLQRVQVRGDSPERTLVKFGAGWLPCVLSRSCHGYNQSIGSGEGL
jgi:hypothetical protein